MQEEFYASIPMLIAFAMWVAFLIHLVYAAPDISRQRAIPMREAAMILHIALAGAALFFAPVRFEGGQLGWQFLGGGLSDAVSGVTVDNGLMNRELWAIVFVSAVLVTAGSLKPEIKIPPVIAGVAFCAAGSLMAVLFMPHAHEQGSLGHHFIIGGASAIAEYGGSINAGLLALELLVINAAGAMIILLPHIGKIIGNGPAQEEAKPAES